MRAMYETGLREVDELILDEERENNDQGKYEDLIETMIEDLLPSGPLLPFHLASKQYPNPLLYLNSFLYSAKNDYEDNDQESIYQEVNDQEEINDECEDTKYYEHIDKYPIPEMINRYDEEEREWVGLESYQNVMYNGEGFTLQILTPSLLYPIGIMGSDYLRSFAPDSSFFISDCFSSIIYSSFLSTIPHFSPNSPPISVADLKNREPIKQDQDNIEITKKRGWFTRKYYRVDIRNTEYEREGAIEFYYFPLFPFISLFKLFDSHGTLIARAHYTNSLLSSSLKFFFPQMERNDTDQNTTTPVRGEEVQEEWIEGGSIKRVDARLVSREYHYSPGSESVPSLPPLFSLFSLMIAYKLDQQPPSITRYCKYLYKKFMSSDCRP